MKWVTAAGFDFTNMAPAEMILARHVEYLRLDDKLKALFCGPELNPLLIKVVPLGRAIELGVAPMLFSTLPIVDRKPAPGMNVESVVIRDCIRFHCDTVTDEEELWEPGLATVVSHLGAVVQTYQQLNYDTDDHGAALGHVLLATRVDLPSISIEQLESKDGEGLNLFQLNIDWTYTIQVNAKTIPPRLLALTALGA